MDQKRLFSILQSHVVSWKGELLAALMLFGVDYSLAQPLYIYVFDLPHLAPFLSAGMAILYAIIARTCSRLRAKGDVKNFIVGIALFVCLMACAFMGQQVAAEVQANDPFALLADTEEQTYESNRHFVAVGLTSVLFSLSLFIGYLVAKEDEKGRGAKQELKMSFLSRQLLSEIMPLEAKVERVKNKPTNMGEERVNARMQKLDNNLNEYKRIEHQLLSEQNYQLRLLELTHKQVVAAIKTVYAKKSFLKSLFS